MKRSTSVNLEESTWQEIADYRAKLNLSSRNDALERIILEWKMLWMFFNKNTIVSMPKNLANISIEEFTQDKNISDSVNDVYDNMPE